MTYMIFAIDFDGTIVEHDFPRVGAPNLEMMKFIKELKKQGHTWILNTMREGEYLKYALSFMAMYDLLPDYVNDNTDELKEAFGNNPRKVFAHVYIDDRNAGGLVIPWHLLERTEEQG